MFEGSDELLQRVILVGGSFKCTVCHAILSREDLTEEELAQVQLTESDRSQFKWKSSVGCLIRLHLFSLARCNSGL
jgi:hypothetical protein